MNATVDTHLKVVGAKLFVILPFVLPWDTDHAIETIKKLRLLGQLEDLLAVQQAKGLTTDVGTTDGNQLVVDMIGPPMNTFSWMSRRRWLRLQLAISHMRSREN